ncbi:MAG TPA: FG-GAP-like repeat-containing protein [Isosphaeraceae bacterium]|nr:FG-GAP-like repeat-containing protein [Isosphaeraceae bacterium]
MLFRTRPKGPRPKFLLRIETLEGRIALSSLIAISDASIAEGDSGAVMMDFAVSRSGDLTVPVTAGYTTADGTARAGTDYTAETGTVTIPAGATSATIAIPVLGNLLLQPDRTFSVTLTGVAGGATSAGFGVQQPFSTGFGPFSVAVGDFNGDGKPDLVVANDNANTVSVLLNTTAPGATTPSFAPGQDFATDPDPVCVVVGDFNLDNRPDLAIVEQSSGLVSIRLNTTAPGAATASFAPAQNFRTGLDPVSAAVGDFNGDGEPDLAVANQFSNSVSLLLNTTAAGSNTPNFAAKQDFATGSIPNSVAIGDFNGDNRPDLAVANEGSNRVSVLLNATAPRSVTLSFSPRTDYGTDSAPISVAVGDLNGDGMPDLAVTNFFSNSVSVLLNTTTAGANTPSFAAKQDFATGLFPDSVAVGDFNGDAVLDLAIANSNSNSVSVLQNTTGLGAVALSFAAKQDFATGTEPASIALADFSGDGKNDLAVANFSSNTVSVLLNTAGPTVAITRATAVGTILDDDSPASVAPAGGDNQSAILGATFAAPLAVKVYNANGHLVQGVSVNFTAPAGGAYGTFPGGQDGVTVITDADGCATAPAFTSNATAGSYVVTAQAAGLTTIVEFHLSNVYSIDTPGNANQAKHSGSTIPLKLEITDDAGNNLGTIDLLVQALFVVDQYGNRVALQSPGNANPGNMFQYDPRTGIYQFNLKTTGYSSGLYRLYFEVGDDPTLYSLSFGVS